MGDAELHTAAEKYMASSIIPDLYEELQGGLQSHKRRRRSGMGNAFSVDAAAKKQRKASRTSPSRTMIQSWRCVEKKITFHKVWDAAVDQLPATAEELPSRGE